MPPKFRFTREEIISAAVELVREEGGDALTARALAARLDSSVKPIFTVCGSMETVRNEVIKAAGERYGDFVKEISQSGKYPAYKSSGMAYIRFAGEEGNLFRLLFMRERRGEDGLLMAGQGDIQKERDAVRPLLELLMNTLGLDEEQAWLFHVEMWIFVHGIASMTATGYLGWDSETASEVLTDAYEGLKRRFVEKSTIKREQEEAEI